MPSEKTFYERQDLKNGQLFQDIHIAHIEDGILNSFATMIPQMGPLDPSVDLTVADLKEMLAPGIYQLDGAKNTGLPYSNFYGTLIVWGGSHGAQIAIGSGSVEGTTKLKAYFRRRYSSTSQFSNWTTFDIEGTADTLVKNLKKLHVGNKSYNGQTEVTITASDLGLGNAVKFIGVTTSNIDDGSTLNPIKINNSNVTAESGNVVLRNGFEYIWTDNGWERLGPDSNAVAAYGTCPTAAATVAKVITVQSNYWRLAPGSIIVIKFDNTNTASNPTFNVNNTGAKPVWYNTSNITTSNLSYAGYKNRYGEYIYDGEHYVFIGWSYDSNTTYTNASLGQGYSTCDTAEATIAKTAALSNYKLVAGGIVAIKFANAVPAAATLNINSTGAKAIYYKNATIETGIIKAGDTGTFIYDGTQYHLIAVDGAVLTESGVAEGSYGPTANVTGSNNTKINIPQLTIDKYGRVTSASNKVYTSVNTDTNTTYDLTASKNSANGNVTLNLTAGGSGSGIDSVTIKGSGATTVTTDANGIITIDSTGGSDVITGNYLPLIGGTLTGNLTLNPGSAYSHLGIDRTATDGVVHQLRTYVNVSDKSVHLEYFQNTDENSKVSLRLGDGYLWTDGNVIYRLPKENHYTYYYNSDNKQVAVIRYNDNDTYHRFAFGHTDPSTGFYEAYVLPPREASVSNKNIVYDILTTKTIKASATELNYCDGVTSSIQTQLNGKVPTTRTINSKALSSNITLAASDVGAVPTTRTVNSKALSSNISLTAADVGAVPTTRTVNDKALNSNITLTSADINKKTIASNVAPMSVVSTGVYISEMPGTALVTGDPTYGALLTVGWSTDRGFQLSGGKGDRGHLYWRYLDSNSTSDGGVAKVSNWLEIYHTGNKPTAADVGASTVEACNTAATTVKQSESTASEYRAVLFGTNSFTNDAIASLNDTTTGTVYVNSAIRVQPNSGTLIASRFLASNTSNTSTKVTVTNDKGSVALLVENNRGIWDYTGNGWAVYAGTDNIWHFNGNATSATKATQDGSGNTITSTYLKLTGGLLTNTCVLKKAEFKSDGTELTAVMVMRDHTTNKNYLQFAITTLGTTSTVGIGSIILGNTTTSGTAGNAKGNIKIYNEKAVACTLEVSADATARTIMLNRLLEVASWNSTTGTLTLK